MYIELTLEAVKIGLVIEFLPETGKKLGGVTVAVHRLANGLVDAGHDVVVVALNDAPPDARYIVHVPFRGKWIKRILSTQIGLQLYSFILNFCKFPNVDVWHFHGYDHFLVKNIGPRLRTLHGCSYREMQFSDSIARKILMFCNYLWEQISISRCDRVLCIGSETANFYKLDYVVDNPFDPSVFRPGIKCPNPRIFYNGYWSGRKRGWFIYEIFVNQLLPQFPNAELVMLCNQVPKHPSVKALQGISDEQLAEMYSSAWLFCYPSIYEGFGMAYMEAMASGTAVVSSPNSGAYDVLQNGHCGRIVQDHDFSSTIIQLLSDADKRHDLEKRGILRCVEYQIDKVVSQHLIHYNAVAKNSLYH